MNEPPRSRFPQRRIFRPALLLWACLCLTGVAESEPVAAPLTPEGSDARHPESRVLTRSHRQGEAANVTSPALKPRPVRAKVPPTSPPGHAHRLIVKFVDALEARANHDGTLKVNPGESGKPSTLRAVADSLQLRFRPLQSAPEASLNALRKRAELLSGQQQPDPSSLVEVVARNSSPGTILAAAKALLPLAEVEYVEIEALDAPPPPPGFDISPATPSLVTYQTYRGSSQGIGVDYVWNTLGIQGHPSLRITDCEYMFNPKHEDLNGLIAIQPGVASMYCGYGDNHGTAAAGILAAGDNGFGTSGSVQNCQMHFYPEYATMEWGNLQTRTATITAAIAASSPGDIVMLEMQTSGPNAKYGPAEYQWSVWDAVKTGTDAGVIIIAAAGNDQEDLDGSAWAEYRSRGDSGAIIVGAGDTSRSRQWFSTYGSRVDLQGWGSGVATTGYGTLATYGGDPNQQYTSAFNGTSSATPIVASAAALLQSVAINKLGTRLTPAEMRSLLVASGRPQSGDSCKPIGPLPDLTAAVPQLLAKEFSSDSPISIPGSEEASPILSTIPVSGVDGVVSSVRVRINELNHTAPWNLDLLLVGPGGQVAALMSDAGGSANLTNATLMFDDAAATAIPESSAIVSGRYRPTNYGSPVETPPPGAVGSVGSTLNALAAEGANGEWKLYVMGDFPGETGSIASWSISFETIPPPEIHVSLSVSSAYGNPTPGTSGEVVAQGTEITASVTSVEDQGDTRHVCTGWSGTGSVPPEGTTNLTTFPIRENSTISWKWKTLHRLNLQTTTGGSVDDECGWHPQGTQVTLTATPEPGHHFAGWTLTSGTLCDGTPGDSQITVMLDSPASVTANFLPNLTAREAYDAWLSARIMPQATQDIPRGDGVPMLLKYAFNLNPDKPDARTLIPGTGIAGLPCLTLDDTRDPPVFRLEYLRRKNSGPNYAALQMADPGKGPRVPMSGTTTTTDIDPDWQRVTIEQPINPLTPRRFFTVEVTLPDSP